VQIVETCVKGNPVNLITEVQVNPSAHNDARATIPVIEALTEAGIRPGRDGDRHCLQLGPRNALGRRCMG